MSKLAVLIARLAATLLPARHAEWGRAMIAETASLAGAAALRFALGCLWAAVAVRLTSPSSRLDLAMTFKPILRPRPLAILCAGGAVLLGFVYMALAGAPARYFAINGGAFLIGLLILAALRGARLGAMVTGLFAVALAGILLTVSLTGVSAGGVSRWVKVGGVLIQPSPILTPILLLALVHLRSRLSALAVALAALALALAPDRAMAGALVAGLAILAASRRGWREIVTLLAASGALLVAMLRADPSPAVPFVDQILFSGFAVHPAAGLAVWGGVLLLLVPALVGLWRDPGQRLPYAVHGAVWLAVVAAAALGNFPTPLVGYGGSAILGYLIATIGLPPRGSLSPANDRERSREYDGDRETVLRAALA